MEIFQAFAMSVLLYSGTTKQQMHGPLPPISQTIQVRQIGHTGHFLHMDTEVLAEKKRNVHLSADLPKTIVDRDWWWERIYQIRAVGTPWTPGQNYDLSNVD